MLEIVPLGEEEENMEAWIGTSYLPRSRWSSKEGKNKDSNISL